MYLLGKHTINYAANSPSYTSTFSWPTPTPTRAYSMLPVLQQRIEITLDNSSEAKPATDAQTVAIKLFPGKRTEGIQVKAQAFGVV